MATKKKKELTESEESMKLFSESLLDRCEKMLTNYMKLLRGDSKASIKELCQYLKNRREEECKREEEFYKNACEVLGSILEKMGYMEETMCNVLMAIRQNECLHPWYPKEAKSTIDYLDSRGIAYKT